MTKLGTMQDILLVIIGLNTLVFLALAQPGGQHEHPQSSERIICRRCQDSTRLIR